MQIKPVHVVRIRREIEHDVTALAQLAQVEAAPTIAVHSAMTSGYTSLRDRISTADLFLVTEGMRDAALDGARDVPDVDLSAERPALTGMVCYSGGLPLTETRGVSPHVVTWCSTASGQMWVAMWAASREVPFPAEAAPFVERISWVPVASTHVPIGEVVALDDGWSVDTVRLLSLLTTTWVMMRTPTMAETRERIELGPKVGRGRRDEARAVKVVDLRRLAHKPTEASEEGGVSRVYRHRWVVRGHWRQQAVGTARAARRTTWVPSYIKGPEDAPFLPSETVFVWRR